ncbi:MAG: FtsX-like permease family protein [Actinomycetota bacterium]
MTAVWIRLRAELRARWRAWLALSLMVAVFFGPALSAFGGARRTNSVYPRFLKEQRAWDVVVLDGSVFAPILWKPDFQALERLPYVQTSVRVLIGNYFGLTYFGDTTGRYGVELNRPKILEGRLPRPDRPDEVAVSVFQPTTDADPTYAADKRALADARVGSTVVLRSPCDLIATAPGCTGNPPVVERTLTVVGRIVSPFDFPPNEFEAMGLVSAAFAQHPPSIPATSTLYATPGIALRFKHLSDLARFEGDLKRLTKGKAVLPLRAEVNARTVTSSARLQGLAVGLLAGFAGLTAILLMAQTLARQTVLESGDHPTLLAIGMDRRQTFALGILRAGAIALIGAVLAGAAAWLSSGLFPFGIFRLAEPHPGLRFDAVPVLLGPIAIVVVAIAAVSVPAWRSVRQAEAVPANPSRAAALLANAGMPPTAVAGARLALERGRGRTAVPVRSTIVIVTLGVAAMVAAFTVSSSISHLLDTPRLYGKTWDKVINFRDGSPLSEDVVRALAAQPEIDAIALADSGAPFTIDGRRVGGIMIHNVKGSLFPPILEGRSPAATNEIVVGTKTLRALGKRVDAAHPPTVQIGIEGIEGTLPITVVGRAAIPPVANYARFGEGIVGGDLDLNSIVPDEQAPQPTDSIVRFRSRSDPVAVVARVAKTFPGLRVGDDFARRPSDVVDFGRVKGMPLILSGILGLIGALSLAHAIASAIRRRRRDLAVLKTIGFVRGQVRRTVVWQASILIIVAVAVGIPIGAAAGRGLWNAIAGSVGVIPSARVPLAPTLLLIPAALVLANLIAAVPARAAARTKPAIVLRAE